MKLFAIYWLIGCVLVGIGAGLRDKRCPNDELPTAGGIMIEIAAWPAALLAATISPMLPPCRPRS